MTVQDFTIHSKADLMEAVETFGFLPFFANSVAGFSVEEHIAPGLWFTDREGPWEWKGSVIRETGCAYGKLFEKKAAFVSRQWFPHLANYRRDGYDFDARCEDGLANLRDKRLYDLIGDNAPVLSKQLKQLGHYGKDGHKGFETIVSRLQSQCYVVISDFVYQRDKYGQTYGWGVAQYDTPERFMGEAFTDRVYRCEPEESREKLLAHLTALFPHENAARLKKFLG